MARVTRSRIINIAEDHTALAAPTALSETSAAPPPALIEVNHAMASNTLFKEDDNIIASELKSLKAAYRTAIGVAKRGRKPKPKKNNTSEASEALETVSENRVLPSDAHGKGSITSNDEAIDSISQNLKENIKVVEVESVREPPVYVGRTTRHQAAIAQAAEEALLKSKATQNVEPAPAPALYPDAPPDYVAYVEEPYSASISSISGTPLRSPMKTLAEVEFESRSASASPTPLDSDEDSFVGQIISRSPAKLVSRIEDSVEALDELEEALEALDQATLAERVISPEIKPHSRSPRATLEEFVVKNRADAEAKLSGRATPARPQSSKSGYASMRVKPTSTKNAFVLKKASSMTFRTSVEPPQPARAPLRRPTSLMPPKEMTKSSKPLTHSTFELPGEAVSRRLKEQREARLAHRESSDNIHSLAKPTSTLRIKSTKPPTKASFELPGEALSRRKKEAHEARLKAQEEEERKRREFKAKPLPKSMAPTLLPRDTAASRARKAKPEIEQIEDGKLSVSKRASAVGLHRPSLLELNKANASSPRAPAHPPVRKQSPTVHGPSMSGRAMQRTVSANDVQIQRQRAKEIYNRDAKWTEDMEREKRDREAAAKRAREEAAERGRQASREWAEKQMAKKMHEGDKGLSAGYGPGGQLGLRG